MPNETLARSDSDANLTICSYIYMAISASSFLVLVYLIKFITVNETFSQGTKLTWRAITNKFNTTLIIGGFSIVGYNALLALAVLDDKASISFYGAGVYLCLAGIESSYMWYTWLRGEAIFDIALPRFLPFMKAVVHFGPIFLYIQPIVALMAIFVSTSKALTNATHIMVAVSGLMLFLFDIGVCSSFFVYLRNVNNTVDVLHADNDRFRITCSYGLLASFFEGGAIFGYLVALTRTLNLEYQAVMVGVRWFMLFGWLSLVLLKVALHDQKEKVKASRNSAMEHSSYSSKLTRQTSAKMSSNA